MLEGRSPPSTPEARAPAPVQYRTPARPKPPGRDQRRTRGHVPEHSEGARGANRKEKRMRAVAVFPKAREVRLIDVDEPQITQPTEVKLRMLEVGICGTDREICAFEYGAPPEGSEYLILGHESLGKVVEVGSAVDDIAVGDLVVTMVRRACSHAACHPCRAGRPDFCATGDFSERGIQKRHGFMAEYVVDEARYMYVVPAALRDVAVLTEPLTIAEKAFAQAVYIERRLPW